MPGLSKDQREALEDLRCARTLYVRDEWPDMRGASQEAVDAKDPRSDALRAALALDGAVKGLVSRLRAETARHPLMRDESLTEYGKGVQEKKSCIRALVDSFFPEEPQ